MTAFGDLQKLRGKPIPNLDSVRESKKGYRQWPLVSDHEASLESCVDVREQGIAGENYYHRKDNPPYYQSIPGSIQQVYLRTGVAARLAAVNESLRPHGLEIFVHDGWRPAPLQFEMRNVWFAGELRSRHPDWGEDQVEAEVANYWALAVRTEDEVDPLSPPPHATAGALDLTIRWISGRELWMGTLFDDVTARAHTDAIEAAGDELSFTEEEARMNRRLLYWVMREAGFANNPTEWWHFSYGDQMWGKLTSAETGQEVPAFYSSVNPTA